MRRNKNKAIMYFTQELKAQAWYYFGKLQIISSIKLKRRVPQSYICYLQKLQADFFYLQFYRLISQVGTLVIFKNKITMYPAALHGDKKLIKHVRVVARVKRLLVKIKYQALLKKTKDLSVNVAILWQKSRFIKTRAFVGRRSGKSLSRFRLRLRTNLSRTLSHLVMVRKTDLLSEVGLLTLIQKIENKRHNYIARLPYKTKFSQHRIAIYDKKIRELRQRIKKVLIADLSDSLKKPVQPVTDKKFLIFLQNRGLAHIKQIQNKREKYLGTSSSKQNSSTNKTSKYDKKIARTQSYIKLLAVRVKQATIKKTVEQPLINSGLSIKQARMRIKIIQKRRQFFLSILSHRKNLPKRTFYDIEISALKRYLKLLLSKQKQVTLKKTVQQKHHTKLILSKDAAQKRIKLIGYKRAIYWHTSSRKQNPPKDKSTFYDKEIIQLQEHIKLLSANDKSFTVQKGVQQKNNTKVILPKVGVDNRIKPLSANDKSFTAHQGGQQKNNTKVILPKVGVDNRIKSLSANDKSVAVEKPVQQKNNTRPIRSKKQIRARIKYIQRIRDNTFRKPSRMENPPQDNGMVYDREIIELQKEIKLLSSVNEVITGGKAGKQFLINPVLSYEQACEHIGQIMQKRRSYLGRIRHMKNPPKDNTTMYDVEIVQLQEFLKSMPLKKKPDTVQKIVQQQGNTPSPRSIEDAHKRIKEIQEKGNTPSLRSTEDALKRIKEIHQQRHKNTLISNNEKIEKLQDFVKVLLSNDKKAMVEKTVQYTDNTTRNVVEIAKLKECANLLDAKMPKGLLVKKDIGSLHKEQRSFYSTQIPEQAVKLLSLYKKRKNSAQLARKAAEWEEVKTKILQSISNIPIDQLSTVDKVRYYRAVYDKLIKTSMEQKIAPARENKIRNNSLSHRDKVQQKNVKARDNKIRNNSLSHRDKVQQKNAKATPYKLSVKPLSRVEKFLQKPNKSKARIKTKIIGKAQAKINALSVGFVKRKRLHLFQPLLFVFKDMEKKVYKKVMDDQKCNLIKIQYAGKNKGNNLDIYKNLKKYKYSTNLDLDIYKTLKKTKFTKYPKIVLLNFSIKQLKYYVQMMKVFLVNKSSEFDTYGIQNKKSSLGYIITLLEIESEKIFAKFRKKNEFNYLTLLKEMNFIFKNLYIKKIKKRNKQRGFKRNRKAYQKIHSLRWRFRRRRKKVMFKFYRRRKKKSRLFLCYKKVKITRLLRRRRINVFYKMKLLRRMRFRYFRVYCARQTKAKIQKGFIKIADSLKSYPSVKKQIKGVGLYVAGSKVAVRFNRPIRARYINNLLVKYRVVSSPRMYLYLKYKFGKMRKGSQSYLYQIAYFKLTKRNKLPSVHFEKEEQLRYYKTRDYFNKFFPHIFKSGLDWVQWSRYLFLMFFRQINYASSGLVKHTRISIMSRRYKKIFKQYTYMLQSYYDAIYNFKYSKHVPPHNILKRVRQFQKLRGFRKLPKLSLSKEEGVLHKRHKFFNWLKYVRDKKSFFKMKIVLDRLFNWVYNVDNIKYIFGTYFHKVSLSNYLFRTTFVYKKSHKVRIL